MDREVFKVGPEALEFMGAQTPIIAKTEGIINDHSEATREIGKTLYREVEEARAKAKSAYAKLCSDTAAKLSGETA